MGLVQDWAGCHNKINPHKKTNFVLCGLQLYLPGARPLISTSVSLTYIAKLRPC